MIPQILFGIGLIGLSLFLLRMHRGERTVQRENRAQDGDRRRRTDDLAALRRRTLSSALIGVAGIMVSGGVLIHHPLAMVLYWSIALAVVVLIIVLAMLDLARSRRYLKELRTQHQAERAALEAEVAAHLRRRRAPGDDEEETDDDDHEPHHGSDADG